jgi:site-specific DNA-methyltransferase (cytosine-N4-specific)
MPDTRYIVGDVFDVLKTLPDASVDLVFTSPPFLALRSYLPSGHPDKAKEIGSEATPAEFIDTMLDVVEECARVLAPHGSLVFELGDTYSGSGGGGGDYLEGGMREGQPGFGGSAERQREGNAAHWRQKNRQPDAWPLDKSLCLIPELFSVALSYGLNPLNGRTTARWRVRNVIAWCRPNPPVGALSDKCRPATSYLTVATKARDRWFDMDAVRHPHIGGPHAVGTAMVNKGSSRKNDGSIVGEPRSETTGMSNPAGAPLLDYWEISTQPYAGSHYATFPDELARRVVLLMCPTKVCQECGQPSRRITQAAEGYADMLGESWADRSDGRPKAAAGDRSNHGGQPLGVPHIKSAQYETVGWTDCGHNAWRPGMVLDPFAGSGTTLAMAQGNGRSSIGIDLDERNANLALERVGPLYMTVERYEGEAIPVVP